MLWSRRRFLAWNAAYDQTVNSFCFSASQPATLLCNNDTLEWARGGAQEDSVKKKTRSPCRLMCASPGVRMGQEETGGWIVDPWWEPETGGGWAFSTRIVYSTPSVRGGSGGECTFAAHREHCFGGENDPAGAPRYISFLGKDAGKEFGASRALTKHIIPLLHPISITVHRIVQ